MIAYTYHRLLLRQIKKINGSFSEFSPEKLEELLKMVSITYDEYEKSQKRSDRAATLMSDELLELNRKMQADAARELELSEEKYYNIVHNISGIIFSHYLVDNKILPVFISRQIEEIIGYSSKYFTSGIFDFLSIIHHDDLTKYQEEVLKAKGHNNLYQIEYRIITKEGKKLWVFEQGRIGIEGSKTKIDGVIININKQKEVEKKLKDIAAEAEEANRAKSEFLTNMSHELRTPMHSILSYAELATTGIELGEPIASTKMALETITKSGNRLLKLLNNLLDLARMESGKVRYNYSQCDIIEVVKRAHEEIQALAYKTGIIINTSYPNNNFKIYIDNDKITQVVINLLSNALKFTPRGKEVNIRIENEASAGFVAIEVRDQGVGIPEEQLETIFNAFVQSSRTSVGSGGTGLGLSVSKEIIKAHGGNIWAFNNKDEGATFRVEIPMKNNGEKA